jgi:hypothetical protein
LQLTFTATIDGSQMAGRFGGTTGDGSTSFGGQFEDQGVVYQEVPQVGKDKDCGPRIWGPDDLPVDLGPLGKFTVRITTYARCTKIEYLDAKGGDLPGSPFFVDTVDGQEINSVTIRLASGKTSGAVAKAGNPDKKPKPDLPLKHWGMAFILSIKGCKNLKVFQFKNPQSQLTGNTMRPYPEGRKEGWETDPEGGRPYDLQKWDGEWSGYWDGPGKFGDIDKLQGWLPKEKHNTDSEGKDAPGMKPLDDGDTFRQITTFLTFICCDGKMLGFYEWTEILNYTFHLGSGWSEPTVDTVGPDWNSPDKNPIPDKAKCQ